MQKVKYCDSIIQIFWIKATLAMTCWHWPWDWETIFYRICAFVNSNLKTMLNSDPKMSDSLNNMEFVRTSQLRFGHFGMDQEFGGKRCLTYCCRYDDASSDIASQKFIMMLQVELCKLAEDPVDEWWDPHVTILSRRIYSWQHTLGRIIRKVNWRAAAMSGTRLLTFDVI